MADFLLEIGLEEIPARMIAAAEAELGRRLGDLLARERLLAKDAKVTTYSTPRRLAALVKGVNGSQADAEERLTGPSWKVAFKDGAPTPAVEAFAKKAGVDIAALEKVTTPKGEYVGATVARRGRTAAEILTAELPKEVLSIYWPKNMYWRAGKPERFVRPVRWVVALLDSDVVPIEIAGIAAGNVSRGHRVLHGHAPVVIESATRYAEELRGARVIASVDERRQSIRKALDAATRAIAGARWREDEPLVETVTHLTEWPSVILGGFEPEYLALPEEVLVTVMRDHQKYFAVEDAGGRLAPHFLTVLNTQVDEAGRAIIRHGNERVLRSRFKDAQFFWDVDQKVPLADRVEMLKSVTFHRELGSYHWKTEENRKVIYNLATTLDGYRVFFNLFPLENATKLAKVDLTTELVKEFTELQGTIGGLYASAQGLGDEIARAIRDQYIPASMEDSIPTTRDGQLLGLADRIQTISAMFGIGQIPSGSKDPFALRRAGNGIIKILAESDLPFSIRDVIAASGNADLDSLARFLRERLHYYLKDHLGLSFDVVNAVLAEDLGVDYPIQRVDDIRNTVSLAKALSEARDSADFLAVSTAFKRMKNILRQARSMKMEIGRSIQFRNLQVEPEGLRLWSEVQLVFNEVKALMNLREYREVLRQIATLRPWVDSFFDKPVVVLHEDPELRAARLTLVFEIFWAFAGIADFSEIVVSGQ